MLSRRITALSLILFVTLALASPWSLWAQTASGNWSTPTLLLDGSKTDGTEPIVYTGPSNVTHLLYFGRPVDDPSGPVALYYARWNDGAWTSPVDVLVTPDGLFPPSLSAVEDSKGNLHVVWNTNVAWHTTVPIADTMDLRSWQTPAMVYEEKPVIQVASAIDADDVIHLIFSTRSGTIEQLALQPDGSADLPVLIHAIPESDYYPYRVSEVATARGRLLVCWAETDETGTARGVWCSNSQDKGQEWSMPEMIAQGHRGARLFYFPRTDQVGRIIWGGVGVGGRDFQLSDDEGSSWSGPVDLTQSTEMAGYNGQVAAMDSAGNLQVLLNPGDGQYVHARTRSTTWLPNQPTGWKADDWIEMAVAEGNTLVVVYWTGGKTFTSHAVVDAPKVAQAPAVSPQDKTVEAPTATLATDQSTPALPAAATASPISLVSTRQPNANPVSSTGFQILLGVGPSFVLVVAVMLLTTIRRRR